MNKTLLTLALAGTLLSASVQASPETDELKATLAKNYPTSTFSEVNETPINGIYELVTGKNIFYTDKTANFLFFGSVYDMKKGRDLTAERRDEVNRISFADLPLTTAIKEVKGNGERVFAIFTDPDCPYCKALENTLEAVDNVTIYRFLYPIASLHPGAEKVAKDVWCSSPDNAARLSALKAHFLLGQTLANVPECQNPVTLTVELAKRLNITGTPTLIAADGRVLPGAAPKEKLEAWLNQGEANGKKATASPVADKSMGSEPTPSEGSSASPAGESIGKESNGLSGGSASATGPAAGDPPHAGTPGRQQ